MNRAGPGWNSCSRALLNPSDIATGCSWLAGALEARLPGLGRLYAPQGQGQVLWLCMLHPLHVHASASCRAGPTKPPCEKPHEAPRAWPPLLQDKYRNWVGQGAGLGAISVSRPACPCAGKEE